MAALASTLDTLGIWNWWILAGVLLVAELLTGTFFFLWLGAAALALGVLMLFFDWSWQVQLAMFAAMSVVLLAGSRFLVRREGGQDESFLNRRAERQIGRSFLLGAPIVDGRGRVRIDDTIWLVRGPDAAQGTRVKVTGVDGATLLVEPDA